MENTISVDLETLVLVQLAAVAVTSRDGVMSIKSLYNNIKHFSPEHCDLAYDDFIASLEVIRHSLAIPKNGVIGVDVHYVSIKRDE